MTNRERAEQCMREIRKDPFDPTDSSMVRHIERLLDAKDERSTPWIAEEWTKIWKAFNEVDPNVQTGDDVVAAWAAAIARIAALEAQVEKMTWELRECEREDHAADDEIEALNESRKSLVGMLSKRGDENEALKRELAKAREALTELSGHPIELPVGETPRGLARKALAALSPPENDDD